MSRPLPLTSSQVDPRQFLLTLRNEGWTTVGGRAGLYERLRPPLSDQGLIPDRWSLLIPLDTRAPDYSELMTAALAELVDSRLPAARSIDLLPRLQMGQADAFHFRKESAAPPGLIGWRDGEELVRSARQTLVAGAKSHISRLRRFSNRFGQFAGRYLDNVLMGQTAVGSYVVTAYAPVDTPIALTSSKLDLASLPGTEAAPAREVTLAIGRALEATQEAVEHFHSSGSLSGFEAGVSSGISFDLLTALKGITKNSDEGEVALEWISYEATDAQSRESKFTFTAADTPVLERASNRLSAEVETDMESTIVGRVHLLTKKELGGPGVFGMETLPPNAKKFRVRLSDPDEYHAAVQAHDRDLVIRVSGRPERDGTLTWLYEASIVSTIGPVDELRSELVAQGRTQADQLAFPELPESNK